MTVWLKIKIISGNNEVVTCAMANTGVELTPIISDTVEYVLLSDKALNALGIAIISVGEGLWCLRDELGKVIRASCQPP